MNTLPTSVPSINERINGFIDAVNKLRAAANAQQTNEFMRDYHKPLEIRQSKGSDWLILDSVSGQSRSVYAFIRLTEGETKTMGKMEVGGIYRPASYRQPAKHVRGSVFECDFGASCASLYGIRYL